MTGGRVARSWMFQVIWGQKKEMLIRAEKEMKSNLQQSNVVTQICCNTTSQCDYELQQELRAEITYLDCKTLFCKCPVFFT